MDAMLTLVLGSLKALLLLTAAGGLTLVLRGRPARLRAVVWATALAGSLLIPVVAPLLPSWSLPLPVYLGPGTVKEAPAMVSNPYLAGGIQAGAFDRSTPNHLPDAGVAATISRGVDWQVWFVTLWVLGAGALLLHLGVGLWRIARAVQRARPVTDTYWLSLLAEAARSAGCRRRVRLLASAEVEVPATVGVLRPVVLVPIHADTWPRDRRRAVLLHELVHVVRFDWAMRMTARLARAAYWFNPLAWWAVRRLDLEQELACDEEVLAHGTRASNYACHLLGIARGALLSPAPAIAGLEMARKTHLEERIMTILKKTTHRRVRLAVLLPAAILVAAMVPAIAAVSLSDAPARPASPELREIIDEMNQIEVRLEPHIERIEALEIELDPKIEMIEDITIEIDHEAIEEIEARMQPFIERMEEIEIDMEPFEVQMEEFEAQMESFEIHVDDGTLEEVQRQIHEQLEEQMKAIEEIHIDMAPFHEQMEAIHAEMEPLYRELEAIHIDMEPIHEQLESLHIDMEPIHEQMEAVHREMEPFHEEMERLGDRLERAISGEVEAVLREHLGAVTAPGAPIDEAAARIADDAHMHVDDNRVRVDASAREVREILSDLLGPHRVGASDAFDAAVDAAAEALSPLEIMID